MGEFEAIGDAVTGGLLARAVEPKAGEIGPDGRTHETHCLNCGTELVGAFCHACGQHAHVRRTLTSLFHDFLHGLLNFEGKIWRTLPLLAWRPGELTRRYIDGQRASFISPIALFLFTFFLMFATVQLLGGNFGELPEAAKQDLREELDSSRKTLARLEAEKAAAQSAGKPTAALSERIGDLRESIKAGEAVQRGDFSKTAVQTSADLPDWLNNSIGKAAKNPELLAYKLQDNASKFSWLIIPLSVPFVWLLFPFSRRFRLYDHAVFVTYSLCFMSLLVVSGVILQSIGLAAIGAILWLLPPFHMYRQLKGAYGLGRWGALWRTTLLTMFAFIVVSLFLAVVVGMGAVS
jgi:hypothetical protein